MATSTQHMEWSRAQTDPKYQAYQILHIAFVVAPVVAGLDKFFHLLTNWDMYLSPAIARMLPIPAHQFMLAVGVDKGTSTVLGLVAFGAIFLFVRVYGETEEP